MVERITSKQNQWIKKLLDVRKRKGAWKNCFIAEGYKLFDEANKSSCTPVAVFLDEALLTQEERAIGDAVPTYQLPSSLFQSITSTKHPQGILGVFERLAQRNISEFHLNRKNSFIRVLVLDRMQDPGNVGTMLRTANALNFDAAVLLSSCADPWQEKALRASMGATFHIPLYFEMESIYIINRFNVLGIDVVASAMEGIALPKFETDRHISLWIGNEGQGLSEDILHVADCHLTIPMPGNAESLNAAAAAAIMMYKIQEKNL